MDKDFRQMNVHFISKHKNNPTKNSFSSIFRKITYNLQSELQQAKEPRGKIKNSWQTKVIFQILPNSIKIDGKYKKENQDLFKKFKKSIKKGCKRRALAQHIYGRTQKDLHKFENENKE